MGVFDKHFLKEVIKTYGNFTKYHYLATTVSYSAYISNIAGKKIFILKEEKSPLIGYSAQYIYFDKTQLKQLEKYVMDGLRYTHTESSSSVVLGSFDQLLLGNPTNIAKNITSDTHFTTSQNITSTISISTISHIPKSILFLGNIPSWTKNNKPINNKPFIVIKRAMKSSIAYSANYFYIDQEGAQELLAVINDALLHIDTIEKNIIELDTTTSSTFTMPVVQEKKENRIDQNRILFFAAIFAFILFPPAAIVLSILLLKRTWHSNDKFIKIGSSIIIVLSGFIIALMMLPLILFIVALFFSNSM